MKKIFTILVAFVLCGLMTNAQEKIFYDANSTTNYVTIFSKNNDLKVNLWQKQEK